MPINLNQVNIAGAVGHIIREQTREDAFNFGMVAKCSSPQKSYRSYLAR